MDDESPSNSQYRYLMVSRENLKPFKFSLKKLNKAALGMNYFCQYSFFYKCKVQLTYVGTGTLCDYGGVPYYVITVLLMVPGFSKGTGTLDTSAVL